MAHCILDIKDRADGSVRIGIEYLPKEEADGKSFAQEIGKIVKAEVEKIEKKQSKSVSRKKIPRHSDAG